MLSLANTESSLSPVKKEWKASLELIFAYKNNKTILSHRKHYGPLVVQQPFYPELNVCHVYIIHPPGGVVGGDNLQIDISLEAQTHVLITTPSAGKFYNSGQLKGYQRQKIYIAENSLIEWFPQETIFFNGCNSELETEFYLESNAKLCAWEINCLGRPVADEDYLEGNVLQKIKIYRDGLPIFLERNELAGNSELLSTPIGLNGYSVFATMVATDMDKEIASQLQEKWHIDGQRHISVSLINDLIIVRYIGRSAEQAKQYFAEIWATVRLKQIQIKTCAPRIWLT